mmetsp:Transcript_17268/g.40078  ORF Transcript_17268/g.40078 Transcript_17268/m.40078 type:complete len:225 (-) Transcript_17268:2613-3287(-)
MTIGAFRRRRPKPSLWKKTTATRTISTFRKKKKKKPAPTVKAKKLISPICQPYRPRRTSGFPRKKRTTTKKKYRRPICNSSSSSSTITTATTTHEKLLLLLLLLLPSWSCPIWTRIRVPTTVEISFLTLVTCPTAKKGCDSTRAHPSSIKRVTYWEPWRCWIPSREPCPHPIRTRLPRFRINWKFYKHWRGAWSTSWKKSANAFSAGPIRTTPFNPLCCVRLGL